jgi:hypothetical protein
MYPKKNLFSEGTGNGKLRLFALESPSAAPVTLDELFKPEKPLKRVDALSASPFWNAINPQLKRMPL